MYNCNQWLPRRGRIGVDPIYRRAVKDLFNQPQHYRSKQECQQIADDLTTSTDGIGFVLLESDPYFFIDLDNHLGDDGQWSQLSQDICAAFSGANVELSKSGKGLHIYGRASHIPPHGCTNKDLGIELYSKDRFVSVTGFSESGDSEHDCTTSLAWLIDTYMKPRERNEDGGWTQAPREDWNGHKDDAELLAAAMASHSGASVFGNHVSFGDLWEARTEKLALRYNDPTGKNDYDRSAADMGLAQHLAFWTGCDCGRMLALMTLSELNRDKWATRDEYLTETILNACAMQVDVHKKNGRSLATIDPQGAQAPVLVPAPPIEPEAAVNVPVPPSDDDKPPSYTETKAMDKEAKKNAPMLKVAGEYMDVTTQLSYFSGCVYIQSINKVLTPSGAMLDQSRFNATYGGYDFAMGNEVDGNFRTAWEAFTCSRSIVWPIVSSICFRPNLEPGFIVEEAGRTMVNTYFPAKVEKKVGDPTRFLQHLAKVLPNKSDADQVLAYMAACVQHPGVKFQWCPLIQGCEGNGKTLFSRVVAKAIGMQFCHFPKAQHIDSNFNAWLYGRLFIGVEDVYIPEKRSDVMESLKPMITGEWQEIEKKGIDQDTFEVCANFILNSNHKDAIRKSRNDRRFAIFFCAQQNAEDLIRDGMNLDYFRDLYDWLKNDGGYAVVAQFLHDYQIPDALNPAIGMQRAPDTTSTAEALTMSLGSIEQTVLEAIEEERCGFAGGFVSSVALNNLMQSMGVTRVVPINKRLAMMQTLGYDYHPGLPKGRVPSASNVDGGARPRLYVTNNHSSMNEGNPAEVLAIYQQAQRSVERNPFMNGAKSA